jgi:predicted transcriptional regulator
VWVICKEKKSGSVSNEGKADLQFALVGSDPATIGWGKDLYAYYLKTASKVKM